MSKTGILGKGIPSAPIRSRTLDLPITSSDALPLSYRRLVGDKATLNQGHETNIKYNDSSLTHHSLNLLFCDVVVAVAVVTVSLLKGIVPLFVISCQLLCFKPN